MFSLARRIAAAPASRRAWSSKAPTVFDGILEGKIPADVVWENDEILAFRDIAPQVRRPLPSRCSLPCGHAWPFLN